MTLQTSAYDEKTSAPTVDEMMKNPHFIPNRMKEQIEDLDHETLFFRNGGTNSGIVGFTEAQAEDYNPEETEEIAEFGEIPIGFDEDKEPKRKVAYSVKTGQGFRVSWEERNENKIDKVSQRMQANVRKVRKNSVTALEEAFKRAQIPELEITTPWNQGGNIIEGIFDGINAVDGATDDDDPNLRFDYSADTILMNPLAEMPIMLSEQIQKYYIGNMANENPVFKGMTSVLIAGKLQIIRSKFITPGDMYIFERNAVGFYSDQLPLTATPLAQEHPGDPSIGGRTMSWRSDIVRKRAIGIDNPKAIVKLKGVIEV